MIWLLLLLIPFSAPAQGTSLSGRVLDSNQNPVLFGSLELHLNGTFVKGTQTDFDGNYKFDVIDPGTYDLKVSYVGLNTTYIRGIIVFANRENILDDIVMSSGIKLDVDIVVIDYSVPLIEQDATSSSRITTAEQIRNLPVKDINAIATQTADLSTVDEDNISIGGGRTNQTNYYIEGVRFNGRRHVSADSHFALEELDPAILQRTLIPSDFEIAKKISSERSPRHGTSFYPIRDEFGNYSYLDEDDNIVLKGVIESHFNDFELRRFRP